MNLASSGWCVSQYSKFVSLMFKRLFPCHRWRVIAVKRKQFKSRVCFTPDKIFRCIMYHTHDDATKMRNLKPFTCLEHHKIYLYNHVYFSFSSPSFSKNSASIDSSNSLTPHLFDDEETCTIGDWQVSCVAKRMQYSLTCRITWGTPTRSDLVKQIVKGICAFSVHCMTAESISEGSRLESTSKNNLFNTPASCRLSNQSCVLACQSSTTCFGAVPKP